MNIHRIAEDASTLGAYQLAMRARLIDLLDGFNQKMAEVTLSVEIHSFLYDRKDGDLLCEYFLTLRSMQGKAHFSISWRSVTDPDTPEESVGPFTTAELKNLSLETVEGLLPGVPKALKLISKKLARRKSRACKVIRFLRKVKVM